MKILFIDDSMSRDFYMWQTDKPDVLIDEVKRQEHGDGNNITSGIYLYGTDTGTELHEAIAAAQADKVVYFSELRY